MYDVIYIDGQGESHAVATSLRDRGDACALARATAAAHNAARMVADDLTRRRQECRDTVLVVPVHDAAA